MESLKEFVRIICSEYLEVNSVANTLNINFYRMELVTPLIEAYAREYTTRESDLIHQLVKASEKELEHTDMLSGRVVGQLLAMLVRISGARRILEVGTFTGYSALYMAEALPDDGEIITCEYNQRYEEIARRYFSKSNYGHKINLKMGKALETIEQLDGTFDMVYLDADKVNYPNYYRKILPMLRSGGLLLADNVLWGGSVLNPDTDKARAIDEFNKLARDDDGVEHVLLTIRDGLQLIRKL